MFLSMSYKQNQCRFVKPQNVRNIFSYDVVAFDLKVICFSSKQSIIEDILVNPFFQANHSIRSNSSDLTRPKTPKGSVLEGKSLAISGKSMLVKYYFIWPITLYP